MPSAFITVREAAELIGLRPCTVRQEIRAGRLIARQKGSKWLVLRASVDEWIALETDEARQRQRFTLAALPRPRSTGGQAAGRRAVAIFKGGANDTKERQGCSESKPWRALSTSPEGTKDAIQSYQIDGLPVRPD